MGKFDFNFKNVRETALIYRAINHPLRQKILNFLWNNSIKRLRVTDIYTSKEIRIEQSVCSQHLGILRRAGIVSERKEGKEIYYLVNYGFLTRLIGDADKHTLNKYEILKAK